MGKRDEALLWDQHPALVAMNFNEQATEFEEVSAAITQLEARKKELAQDLLAAFVVAGVDRAKLSQFIVVERCKGKAPSRIDGKRLVAAGVDADIVKACTVPGAAWESTKVVDMRKGKAEEITDVED